MPCGCGSLTAFDALSNYAQQQALRLDSGKHVYLGRIRPKEIIDLPGFRAMTTPDGRLKVVLKLDAYYDQAKDAQPPPTSIDYATKAMPSIKQVLRNDMEGCCVVSSTGHGQGIYTGNESGTPTIITDKEIDAVYHGVCGPGDNGCVITDVLDAWRDKGFTFGGKLSKIDDYVAVDWTNKLMVQVAIDIFGGGRVGINLPNDWTCTDCVWGMASGRIVGGHDVRIIDYNETGPRGATWAGIIQWTWQAFLSRNWNEEMYVELSPEWYKNGNLAPNGIDVATLKADLELLRQGKIPPIGPPPPPPPPPPPILVNTLAVTTQMAVGSYEIGGGLGIVTASKPIPVGNYTVGTAPPPPPPPVTGAVFTEADRAALLKILAENPPPA